MNNKDYQKLKSVIQEDDSLEDVVFRIKARDIVEKITFGKKILSNSSSTTY